MRYLFDQIWNTTTGQSQRPLPFHKPAQQGRRHHRHPPTLIFFLHPISHRSCIFHFGRPEPFSSTIYSLSISSVGNGFASRSSGHSCLFSFGCATIWCIAFSTRFIGRPPMKNCGFTILLAVDWLCVCLRVWEKETVYGVLLMWLREHFQWYGGGHYCPPILLMGC